MVVNIYARTQLRLTLVPKAAVTERGAELSLAVHSEILRGRVAIDRSLSRLLAPTQDLAKIVAGLSTKDIPRDALLEGESKFDTAKILAHLERKNRKLAVVRDEQIFAAQHGEGALHFHIKEADIAGGYHVGMYVEGTYCPEHGVGPDSHHTVRAATTEGMPTGCHSGCRPQRFSRILTTSVAVASKMPKPRVTRKAAKKEGARKVAKAPKKRNASKRR